MESGLTNGSCTVFDIEDGQLHEMEASSCFRWRLDSSLRWELHNC